MAITWQLAQDFCQKIWGKRNWSSKCSLLIRLSCQLHGQTDGLRVFCANSYVIAFPFHTTNNTFRTKKQIIW